MIGTTSALGALVILGAVGSLYLFRRSRSKQSRKPGPKPRPGAEDAELAGHDVPREMDATRDRPLDEVHLGGLNELVGRRGRELRAELMG